MLRGLINEPSSARGAGLAMCHRVAEHDDPIGQGRKPKAAIGGDNLMSRFLQVNAQRAEQAVLIVALDRWLFAPHDVANKRRAKLAV